MNFYQSGKTIIMRQTEQVNLEIENLSHEGRGIAKNKDGVTCFVDNALPGEMVGCTITYKKSNYHEAYATKISNASSNRVEPKCKHFGVCGGCSLQHMDHDLQVTLKQDNLLEQLKHFGNTAPKEIMPPIIGEAWGYRTKARLSAKYVLKKEKVLVGFREKKGRFVADLSGCEILVPAIGKKIPELSALIQTLSIPREIPQIEIACTDTENAIIIRHMKDLTSEDKNKISEFAKTHDLIVFTQRKGPKTITKLYPNDDNSYLSYKLPDLDIEFKFYPTDFTQINQSINKKMIAKAIELLDINENDNVIDLFCGIGNFSLPIAKIAKTVLGVEGEEVMVERAAMNARHNNILNVRFEAMDLSKSLPSLLKDSSYNKLLLDPARSGAENVARNIPKHINRIVYVSCNTATFAKDVGILCQEHGFSLDKVGILDMFPHTQHAETIGLLTR